MDDLQGSSGSLPPFLSKTYEMVDDPSSNSIVSWSETSKSFVVWNPPDFARDLLPRFFKHNNFSSFIRQLNTYGFRKIDPEKWEFANDDFVRGQPNLMRNIHRRKPVHSHSPQNVQTQGSVTPLNESERQALRDDIDRLKNEKESLLLEVQQHEQERAVARVQVLSLKSRLHSMEIRHKTMVSNLADMLQKPGLALSLLFESEPTEKKRRLPRLDYLQDEGTGEEISIGNSQISDKESLDGTSCGLVSMVELYDQLESSLTLWENIMGDVRQTFDQRVSNSNSLDLDEATSCAEGSAIDMNAEPVVVASSEPPRPAPSKEQKVANPAPTGVNDVFWEQFLTENPGASETQEVQSERKDKNENKSSSDEKYWWNVKTVHNLADQMGHLTSTERT